MVSAAPSSVFRTYPQKSFNLTARKLVRIAEVAKQRVEKIAGGRPVLEKVSVAFKNSKKITLASVESALGLDNVVKNRIVGLEYTVDGASDDGEVHSISVEFDAASGLPPVRVSAFSSDLPWMDEALGAVEEQVERTLESGFGSGMSNALEIAGFATMGVGLFAATIVGWAQSQRAGKTLLPAEGVSELAEMAKGVSTESEKLDFVFQYLVKSLKQPPSPTSMFLEYASDYRTYMIGVPLLVALIAAFAAIFWCSPKRVFVWGDYEEHYNKLIDRRKLLWYGVVIALAVGVLGNLFMLGISPSLASKAS